MTHFEDVVRLRSTDAQEFADMSGLLRRVINLEMAVLSAVYILDKPRLECRDMNLMGATIGPVMEAHYQLTEFAKTLSAIRKGLETGMYFWADRKDRELEDLKDLYRMS